MAIRLNTIDPTTYGASLLDYSVGSCADINKYLAPSGRMQPVKLKSKVGLRKISLTFDFSANTVQQIVTNISDVTAALRNEANLELPDGFYYACELDSVSAPKEKAPWIQQVTFNFVGYRHGSLVTTRRTVNGNINVTGNCDTPATVKLTPSSGATTMKFNGITISNVSGAVTIDGINTTVKDASGNNKFKDTNITEWPVLKPGSNSITLQGVSQAEISYYPIYL